MKAAHAQQILSAIKPTAHLRREGTIAPVGTTAALAAIATSLVLLAAPAISGLAPAVSWQNPVSGGASVTLVTKQTATAAAPTITSFSPSSGGVGTPVTLTGTNLSGATRVAFNGTAATSYTIVSATQITTSVPVGASSGAITVTTPAGTATSGSAGTGAISFVSVGIASVTSGTTSRALTLPTGYQAGDLLVAWLSFSDNAQSIIGMTGWTELPWSPLDDSTTSHVRCFYKIAVMGEVAPTVRWTNNTKVLFETGAWRGVDHTNPIVGSGGRIDRASGNNAVGPSVTNPLASAWAVGLFTFRSTTSTDKSTTFSTFTPAGLTKRADSNLSGASSASWLNAATTDSAGPIGVGSHQYTGTTTATTGSSHKAAALLYVAPDSGGAFTVTVTAPAPTITSFSPGSGSVGTPVTLTGTNLSGATRVAFNGTAATSYTTVSATQITTSVPVGASSGAITVTTPAGTATSSSFTVGSPVSSIAVYVGYYDTHHPAYPQPKPSPWFGSPSVVFIGVPDSTSVPWTSDTSAVRIDNLSGSPLTNVVVTVDIGSKHFALWGTNTIPTGFALILSQTAFENFDGSDSNPAGCYGCDPALCTAMIRNTVPVVHMTINSVTTDFYDTQQVLNTRGVDSAGCPDTGNTSIRRDESEAWTQLG